MKSLLQRFVFLVCILGCAVPVLAAPKKKAKKTTESQERRIALANKNSDSGKRVALVIGNGAYSNSPLNNPVNDAKDIAAKLRDLGFEVIERKNLTTRQIGGTLREFRSKLAPGAVALVFYAGHGLQIKGDNYLPAVDADINSEEDVPNQSLSVKQIMDVLDESKSRLNLVFLDACRNNPYARSFRSAGSGLARVSAPSGTLISYATKPGSVAADGTGRNGLYTSKLLAQMDSNLQIEQTLKRVVTEVKAASSGKQEPWMEGSIEGDFCFAGCVAHTDAVVQAEDTKPVATPVRVKSRDEIEQETWESVRASNNAKVIKEFLKQYPKGRFAGQARVLIAAIQSEAAAATPRHEAESKQRLKAEQQAAQAAQAAEAAQVAEAAQAAQAAQSSAQTRAQTRAMQMANFDYFENGSRLARSNNPLENTTSPLGTAFDILTLPSKTSEMQKLRDEAALRPSTWGKPDSMIASASAYLKTNNSNHDNKLFEVVTE